MTTQDTIDDIRSGLRLISQAFTKTNMLINQGFSLGSLSSALKHGIINTEDWKQLNTEISQAVDAYWEKNK